MASRDQNLYVNEDAFWAPAIVSSVTKALLFTSLGIKLLEEWDFSCTPFLLPKELERRAPG